MTSKLDTAGLVVEQLRAYAGNSPDDYRNRAADLIEALTQSAAPDMEPVAWLGTNLDGESEPFLNEQQAAFWSNGACNAEPLILQSIAARQLSAIQERAERAERERDEALLQAELSKPLYSRRQLEARLSAAEARVAELTEALTPSADTKADYIGEFKFSIDDIGIDEDGEPFEGRREVTVPWTTVKEIMAAIRARAALAHKGEGRS